MSQRDDTRSAATERELARSAWVEERVRSLQAVLTVPLKVTKRTKELVRLGSAMERCTQGEFVKRAVDHFIENHQDELKAGLAHAAEVLR